MHDADNPKHPAIIFSMVSENNGKNNATEVSGGAGETRNDSYGDLLV